MRASRLAWVGSAAAVAAGGKPPATEATFLHLNAKVVAHVKHHTDTISGKLPVAHALPFRPCCELDSSKLSS